MYFVISLVLMTSKLAQLLLSFFHSLCFYSPLSIEELVVYQELVVAEPLLDCKRVFPVEAEPEPGLVAAI